MVSNPKRMDYNFDNEFSSSGEETQDEKDYHSEKMRKTRYKSGSQSKNAKMARENRLKKKIHLERLESEVKKLKSENKYFKKMSNEHLSIITDLEKQIKYLKSALANSKDIGNLIRNIHHNTGMSVRTSLGQTLSLNNDYLSKPKQHIARKTAHPWDETQYPNCLTPESDFVSDSPTQDDLILNNFQCRALLNGPLLEPLPVDLDLSEVNQELMKEHNYTSLENDPNNVGVCVHFANHEISLEFCAYCSENAQKNWRAH